MLAVAVLAAALYAAIVQAPAVLVSTGDAARPAALAQDTKSCTDTDGGRERNLPRYTAASTSDSTLRWRSLHAALPAETGPGAIVVTSTTTPARPRAAAAPTHLLHTPLLI